MSQENVEIVREAIEAFNRGDFEAALKRMHRDIEWQALDTFPDAETYHGRDYVLATFRVSGEGAGSGVGVESPAIFQLGEMRDKQVIRVGMFSNESDALEAAGLRR